MEYPCISAKQFEIAIIICLCQINKSDCKNGSLYFAILTTSHGLLHTGQQIVGKMFFFLENARSKHQKNFGKRFFFKRLSAKMVQVL